MLVLSRKLGQVVRIDLLEGVDPRTPIGDLFAEQPITISITKIHAGQVRIAIAADSRLRILREELCLGSGPTRLDDPSVR